MKNILFKNEIQEKAISLKKYGINDFAWKYDDINQILDILLSNKIGIIGGDVLDKEFKYTYDNWSIEKTEVAGENFVMFSIEKTKKYIENYIKNNGKDFYFVIVLDK
jgi:hypothetical protein